MSNAGTAMADSGFFERARRAVLYVLFALVLLIPKTLSLRRRPGVWNTLRAAVALLGAILVVVPSAGWIAAVIGLLLFVVALLVPPSEPEASVDDRARELGALVVVNGGEFHTAEGACVPAQLYVAPGRVVALGPTNKRLVEIPMSAVSSLRAEQAGDGWRLRVAWNGSVVEFFYHGPFAEHLVRVAENTLSSQWRPELRVFKKAAG